MASEPPQPTVDELLLARGLVSDVVFELIVADPLEDEPEDPDQDSDVVQPDQCVAG